MKDRYRLDRRRNQIYAVDRKDLTRESLETDYLRIARRLIAASNEASNQAQLKIALGCTYLSAHDPVMMQRTWQIVMDEFCQKGKEQTWTRRKRAMKMAVFKALSSKNSSKPVLLICA